MELSFRGRKRAQKSFLEEVRSQERVPGKMERRGWGKEKKNERGLSGKFGGKPKINFETSSPCLEWAIIMISRLT